MGKQFIEERLKSVFEATAKSPIAPRQLRIDGISCPASNGETLDVVLPVDGKALR